MVKYRETLRLKAMGVSVRNIAFSCGCSTATAATVADRAKASGLERPLPEEMNDAAIRAILPLPDMDASLRKPAVDVAVPPRVFNGIELFRDGRTRPCILVAPFFHGVVVVVVAGEWDIKPHRQRAQ